MFKKNPFTSILILCLVPILFFVIAIITLPHYGISWDESFHFQRGQAYLHYFLTGKENFLDLPAYPRLNGDSDFMGREGEQDIYLSALHTQKASNPSFRRSYYQSDVFTFSFLTSGFDGGHPPTSDILSALFNYILYQKLGILGDIEAYHSFEIFISSVLILGVAIFTYYNFGLFPAFVSALSLALYPLFFGEAHFNIKDPPEAAFFGLAIISFFFGIALKRWKIIILAAVFGGLALGTKFNALFIPFVILPWFVFKWFTEKVEINRKMLVSLIGFPVVVVIIFFIFWPLLWRNTFDNFLRIINYYRDIGIGTQPGLEKFIIERFNTYAIRWIIYTTPLPILTLSVLGIIYSIFLSFYKKKNVVFLALLWLIIPIIRVTLPNTNIYGGVRQIMEFIPALSIMCGIGTYFLINIEAFKKIKPLVVILVVMSFFFVSWEIFKIHPNENIYFNQLVGGLSGAENRSIPSWGNTYGNIYLQGVQWLNKNAEINSKIGLPIANMVNVPRIKLRPDINFSNAYPSGPQRQGEYVMEMSHDWPPKKWYGFAFYDTTLNSVYEIKVDGVTLLKIWKNDFMHTKSGFKEEVEQEQVGYQKENNRLIIDIGKNVFLTRLKIHHGNKDCQKQKGGYIRLSLDGKSWTQEPETIGYPQIPLKWLETDENTFVFLFVAKKARYIFLDTEMDNSCILKNPRVRISSLEGLL